jgi:chromosome segregation ATPase
MKEAINEIVNTALENQSVKFAASIATLTAEISQLQRRLQQKDDHIKELTTRIEQLEAGGGGGDNNALLERISDLEYEHDELEQYGRRMNIRLDNVPEQENETPASVERKALEMLAEAGEIIKSSDVVRMHRLGQLRPDRDQPQRKQGQVIIRLNNWAARESAHLVRNAARTKGYPIRQDLTKNRRDMIAEANAQIREWGNPRGDPVYCYANINCVVTMRCGRSTQKIHCEEDLKNALRHYKPH